MASEAILNILGITKRLTHDLEELSLEDHTAVIGMLRVLHERRVLTFQREQQEKQHKLQEEQQRVYAQAVEDARKSRQGPQIVT